MVPVLDVDVLLALAWLVVLFAAGFRYRWGSLPSARALLVVASALVWLGYSLTQLSAFLAAPFDDVAVAVAVGFLVAGGVLLVRWWRRDDTAKSGGAASGNE
ncbi:hypothetical protein [Halobacterium rubrum]|uniref:hypothetical protein n=1 Tax=Halobacterium TaxID=2239 RepID=UPI001F1C33DA|nr:MULTISPECIES: hypothetical protein [Halobacterium]MDH5019210.1 hypothetical protein [Halobacterium rubrum]